MLIIKVHKQQMKLKDQRLPGKMVWKPLIKILDLIRFNFQISRKRMQKT